MANVVFRGVTLDSRTARMMDVVALRVRPKIVPTQGSFSTAVDKSKGTHAGAGAIDLSIKGLDDPRVNSIVKLMRQIGFAAWHRTESDGFTPHIHGIAVGAPGLSPEAADQVVSLRNGRNGLKNQSLDPHRGMKLPVISFEQFLKNSNTGEVVDLSELRAKTQSTGQIVGIAGRAMIQMGLPATRDNYKKVQNILGFFGPSAADGLPGLVSLSRLGDAFGFTVKP
jgi:hypothetical protein